MHSMISRRVIHAYKIKGIVLKRCRGRVIIHGDTVASSQVIKIFLDSGMRT